MSDVVIRAAAPADAEVCAAIRDGWSRETPWLPDGPGAEVIGNHYRSRVFGVRPAFVANDPVSGFVILDGDEVTALFVGAKDRGRGLGKALLDHVKSAANRLELWTFQANLDALRFYAREGFHELRRTDGDNEEALPDVLLEWRAA